MADTYYRSTHSGAEIDESIDNYLALSDAVTTSSANATAAANSATAAASSSATAAAQVALATTKADAAAESASAAASAQTAAAGSASAASADAASASEDAATAAAQVALATTKADAAAESASAAASAQTAAAGSASAAQLAAENAQSIAQGQKGWYETPALLRAAHPTGENGDWAIVGSTDTNWFWDSDIGDWKDSFTATDLSNYYTMSQSDGIFATVTELATTNTNVSQIINGTTIVAQATYATTAGSATPTSHASSATTYGTGTDASYGHVKLSASTSSTSGDTAGIAATPSAVKAAYDLANTANTTATAAQTTADSATTSISGKAPTSHASSATTYGTGTDGNYGHLKLSASTSSTSGVSGGIAATPSAVASAYTLASGKAPTSHASTASTYGLGTATNYGHTMLSASTSSTLGTGGGTAATPSAVKTAYDLAVTARTYSTSTPFTGTNLQREGRVVTFRTTSNSCNFSLIAGKTLSLTPIAAVRVPVLYYNTSTSTIATGVIAITTGGVITCYTAGLGSSTSSDYSQLAFSVTYLTNN